MKKQIVNENSFTISILSSDELFQQYDINPFIRFVFVLSLKLNLNTTYHE